MGLTNPWDGLSFKKLFKQDQIVVDDFVFRLHHQLNFFFLGIGVLFIFAENYLDGKSIVCRNANDYETKFCWLHGTGYIGESLSSDLAAMSGGAHQCRMNTESLGEEARNNRVTSYYIWLPFLLLISMGTAKLGRTLWKEFLEGGLMKTILLRRNSSEDGVSTVKIAEEFKKRRRTEVLRFTISYIFCEVLNLLGVLVSMAIFNRVLLYKYFDYGSDYINYILSSDEETLDNPMCQIFPTIVSCTVRTGGSSGGTDVSDNICILSNNLFNMYYFLIIWFWWVLLILLSAAVLVYRFFCLLVPSLMGVGEKLTFPEKFVLCFIKENLEPEDYEQVLSEVNESESKKRKNSEEEPCMVSCE